MHLVCPQESAEWLSTVSYRAHGSAFVKPHGDWPTKTTAALLSVSSFSTVDVCPVLPYLLRATSVHMSGCY